MRFMQRPMFNARCGVNILRTVLKVEELLLSASRSRRGRARFFFMGLVVEGKGAGDDIQEVRNLVCNLPWPKHSSKAKREQFYLGRTRH